MADPGQESERAAYGLGLPAIWSVSILLMVLIGAPVGQISGTMEMVLLFGLSAASIAGAVALWRLP